MEGEYQPPGWQLVLKKGLVLEELILILACAVENCLVCSGCDQNKCAQCEEGYELSDRNTCRGNVDTHFNMFIESVQ